MTMTSVTMDCTVMRARPVNLWSGQLYTLTRGDTSCSLVNIKLVTFGSDIVQRYSLNYVTCETDTLHFGYNSEKEGNGAI